MANEIQRKEDVATRSKNAGAARTIAKDFVERQKYPCLRDRRYDNAADLAYSRMPTFL